MVETQEPADELAEAQRWQTAQAWTDAQKIASGDRRTGSWERIGKAADRARERIRERVVRESSS